MDKNIKTFGNSEMEKISGGANEENKDKEICVNLAYGGPGRFPPPKIDKDKITEENKVNKKINIHNLAYGGPCNNIPKIDFNKLNDKKNSEE